MLSKENISQRLETSFFKVLMWDGGDSDEAKLFQSVLAILIDSCVRD